MKLPGLAIVLIPLLASGAETAKDSCFECHSVMEGMSVAFKDDVHYHNGISCADCHGGDPREDDANRSKRPESGFKVRVARQATPAYCGRCHSDTNYMHRYKPQQRVDQLALYRTSVHGRQLAAGNQKSAQCVDCHSIHDIRAVSDKLSPAHPQNVTETCAKCHAATAEAFRKSPHAKDFNSEKMPGCTACHASHATASAGRALLTGEKAVCKECHDPGSDGEKAAVEIARLLASLETAGTSSNAILAQVRVAVHTCDVTAVKRAAGSVRAGGEEAGRK